MQKEIEDNCKALRSTINTNILILHHSELVVYTIASSNNLAESKMNQAPHIRFAVL